jgi:hypothetical protein
LRKYSGRTDLLSEYTQVTKDFIQRCLTHRVTDRPDIHLLFDDAYFRKGKK